MTEENIRENFNKMLKSLKEIVGYDAPAKIRSYAVEKGKKYEALLETSYENARIEAESGCYGVFPLKKEFSTQGKLVEDLRNAEKSLSSGYWGEIAGEAADAIESHDKAIAELKQKSFECWITIHDGKPTEHKEESGIGIVHGLHSCEIGDIEEGDDLFQDMLEALSETEMPAGALSADFMATGISHEPGQMSHPETGQWDFPPHWQMDLELISFNYTTELDSEIKKFLVSGQDKLAKHRPGDSNAKAD